MGCLLLRYILQAKCEQVYSAFVLGWYHAYCLHINVIVVCTWSVCVLLTSVVDGFAVTG